MRKDPRGLRGSSVRVMVRVRNARGELANCLKMLFSVAVAMIGSLFYGPLWCGCF